jgi:pSer/pThr/pTyr-binding forkhead associated (FHA) protein
MTYQLVPLDRGSLPAISLHRPVLLIGRHPECDVRINLPKVSRRHCCVALAYDRVLIRDLGSHNGLRVNGRLVEEARLHAGDEVAIGPIIYQLVAEGEPALTASSAPGRGAAASSSSTGSSTQAGARQAGPMAEPEHPDEVDLVPLDEL